jgi:putative ABC transport system ATP-binding protein
LRKDRLQGTVAAYSLSVPRLDVRLGDKVLITGPSGCGKSTLLDALGMILRPDEIRRFSFFPEVRKEQSRTESGAIRENHDSSPRIRPHENNQPKNVAEAWTRGDMEALSLWRRHVGYVLQTGGLLPFVSVRENIRIPRRLLGLSGDLESDPLPEKLIATLGIRHLLQKLPTQLSVGERQRVAIARALAASPSLVLADEPTAALDPANAAAVLSLFSRMVDELGAALILVSHAPEQLYGMGFRHLRVTLDPMVRDDVTGTRAALADDALSSEDPGDDSPEPSPPALPRGDGRAAGGTLCPR